VDQLNILPETASAIISTIVAALAALGGLYLNKRFRFVRELRRALSHDEGQEAEQISPELALTETEKLLKTQATTILDVIRPYHRFDPITIADLHRRLADLKKTNLSLDDFKTALAALLHQDRLPGIERDGEHLFIHEEHIAWKKQIATSEKRRIAQLAFSFIKSGDVVALDAGTTTLEIARLIATGFRDRALKKITVVTSSFLIADALVTSCSELGLEDHDPMFRLYIIGGRVRLNTMAIVDDNKNVDESVFHDFDKVLPALGGADVGFVGTNGVLKDVGFTTADLGESKAKASLVKHTKRRFIVCDDEKFGLRQAQVFATFDEDITVITAENRAAYAVRDYTDYFATTKTDILIA
jgi:DeoR family transcriptional regulator, fructose operon transcriptional repressor